MKAFVREFQLRKEARKIAILLIMLKYLFIYCILIGLATVSNSLSILLIEPVLSPSHHIWTTSLVKGLLRKGHHVHAVSFQEIKINDKLGQNLTYTIFENVLDEIQEEYDPAEWEKYTVFYMTYFLYEWGILTSEKLIETEGAKELLEMIKNTEFDVIVQDISMSNFLYGVWEIAKGKPPVVGYCLFGPAPWFKYHIGEPSYPTIRSYPYKDLAKPISLWERTLNVLYYIVDDLIRYYYYIPNSQRIAEQYIGHKIRPLSETEKNIPILLINTHSAFEPGIPLPPNAIEIGGLHAQTAQRIADEETATYPDSIREFLDGAENGAVVISLGTNVKWKAIGLEKLKIITLALSKLKQRILWKLDVDLPFQVPNIMVVKWMPQNEILGHKNVKAIWTHGGLLSTQEAIWKGIPIIGMPFFMDQKFNVALLEHKGVAVRLNINNDLSTESVLDAFNKILYNESYTKNMKQLSSEFRDRPVPPLDLAVWWIEYAVRNPNGSLESELRSQSWVEKHLIDIYAFLLLNIIVILWIIFFLWKKLFNFCRNYVYTKSKLQKNKQM